MRRIIFCSFLLASGVAGAAVLDGQIAGAAAPKPRQAAGRAAPSASPVVFTSGGAQVGNTVQFAPGASVAVTGTPSVQIANSAVPVIDLNDGQDPYQESSSSSIPANVIAGGTGFPNPPGGRRLVVETVSASLSVPTGTVVRAAYLALQDSRSTSYVWIYLTPVKISSDGSKDYYAATHQLRAYTDTSGPPRIVFDFAGPLTAPASLSASIEGYLVKTS